MGDSRVDPNLTTIQNSPHRPNARGLASGGPSSRPEGNYPQNGGNTQDDTPIPIPTQSILPRLTVATKTGPGCLPSPADSTLPSSSERASQEDTNVEHTATNHESDTDSEEDDNVPLIHFVPWYYRHPFPPPKSGSPVLRVQQLASRQARVSSTNMPPCSWSHPSGQFSDKGPDANSAACDSSVGDSQNSDENTDTDSEADHDSGFDHAISHPMVAGSSTFNSTRQCNTVENNFTPGPIPNFNSVQHLTVSPDERVPNQAILDLTSQSTPFRRPLTAIRIDPAVHLMSSHSSTASMQFLDSQTSSLGQSTLPLSSTTRWNRPMIKQDYRHYRRNISRYQQDDTLPPPAYSVDQLQASAINLNTGNEGDRLLPPYVCTLRKEGPLYMKMEFWDDHTRAKHRIWKMRYFQLWGTCLRVYQHKPKGQEDDSHLLYNFGTQELHSGLAMEYRKRPYVFRIRVGGFQFLVQAKSSQEMVYWIDALHASANIALPIDDRHIPRFTPLTHRHRHHH